MFSRTGQNLFEMKSLVSHEIQTETVFEIPLRNNDENIEKIKKKSSPFTVPAPSDGFKAGQGDPKVGE